MLALCATACFVALGTGSALAQSGGAVAPGDPTTPAPTPAPAASSQYVFPVAGPHSYGQGFGAARFGHSHQGQDVMAACGTPLVAASRSKVIWRKFQGLAGNYVVIRDIASRQSYMYAHLAYPAMVLPKQALVPGQQIGVVGRTGDATACHLHFELWTKKGYYRGGRPINPLLTLQTWDNYS
jgi:murein DD-endopeptidase MepM/ murein hydrolase activator NlpD